MPFDQNDIARLSVTYSLPDNVEAISRYTGQYTGPSQLSDVDALVDWSGYLEDIYQNVSPDIANVVTITGFELSRVLIIGGAEVLEFIGTGVVLAQPTNINPMLPHGVAMLFSARLSGTGRGAAKKFFPGFTEAAAETGTWQASVLTAMAPAVVDWSTVFGNSDLWTPGAFSVAKGFRTMFAAVARSIPAYQRRRKPGVGS